MATQGSSMDGDPSGKDEELELWNALFQTTEAIKRVRAKELRQYKVTAMEAAILSYVDSLSDKATTSQIAKRLRRKHHGVLSLVSAMFKKGLLIETGEESQEKASHLELTSKGKRILKKANQRQSLHQVFGTLTKPERIQLQDALLKISQVSSEGMDYKENLYHL